MKVTREKTENHQLFLNIEMEPEEVQESIEESFDRMARRTKVAGFRRGKAPRELLEHYIDRDSLFKDALSNLVPEAYEKALKQENIEAVAQPNIEITKTEPVVFKATVPLKPVVKLGDYHKVRMNPEPATVTEEQVKGVIEQLRHQVATWEPVERPVEFNDVITFDVESSADGQPFINQKGARYQVQQNLTQPVPGFAEQLVGIKKGEKKDFSLSLPSDYAKTELAGKEASFAVTVTEISQEKLPEPDDEFALKIGPDFKTLDSLKERITADLQQRAEETVRADFEDKVIEEVANLSNAEFPPVLVEREIDRLIDQQARRLQMSGITLEQYMKSTGKKETELRDDLREIAAKRVTHALVLNEIVEAEKIEVSDAEIDAEIEKMLQSVTRDKVRLQKSLNTPQSRESISQLLSTQKAVQRLAEIAKGSEEK